MPPKTITLAPGVKIPAVPAGAETFAILAKDGKEAA
jgi:hypothetical protein